MLSLLMGNIVRVKHEIGLFVPGRGAATRMFKNAFANILNLII